MTRQTTRKTGTERREEIALAALRIIGQQGLAGLTTAALAKEVALTSGALFRHFASREAILDEAVLLAVTRAEATFPDSALPALERLRGLAHARIKLLSQEPGIAWLLRSEQARSTLPPTAVKRLRRLVRRSRAYIRAALNEASAAGQVRSDVSPDVQLLVFTATVHALIGQPGVGGRARSTQTTRAVDGLLAMLTPSESKRTGR